MGAHQGLLSMKCWCGAAAALLLVFSNAAAAADTAGAAIGAVAGSLSHHWETVYDAETGWSEHLGDSIEPGVGYRRKR